jgi:hypothetical protein
MEISPITAVRLAPAFRSRETDLGLTDIFEIEKSSRTDDETYSPGGSRAASGFDDDEDHADDQEDSDSQDEAAPKAETTVEGEGREISIFA